MSIDSDSAYLQLARLGNAFYLYESRDGKGWYLVRVFHFEHAGALKVGLIAQCPEGKSATIHFSDVRYRAGRVQDVWKGGICITVLLAHVSYRFYERPFLRFKRRFTFIPSRDC